MGGEATCGVWACQRSLFTGLSADAREPSGSRRKWFFVIGFYYAFYMLLTYVLAFP